MLREEDGTNGGTIVSSFCNASLCVRAITLEWINSCLLGDAPLSAPCIYGPSNAFSTTVLCKRPFFFFQMSLFPAVVSNNVCFSTGFWWSREELKKLQSTDDVFVPREAPRAGALIQNGEYIPVFQSWERALRRSMNWYGKT